MAEIEMSDGNAEQIRVVANAVAESAADRSIQKFFEMNPDFGQPRKAEIPSALKLWGTVGAALLVAAIIGTATWVVTTLNGVQQTLARMDERSIIMAPIQEKRFAALEDRTTALENQQKGKP